MVRPEAGKPQVAASHGRNGRGGRPTWRTSAYAGKAARFNGLSRRAMRRGTARADPPYFPGSFSGGRQADISTSSLTLYGVPRLVRNSFSISLRVKGRAPNRPKTAI